MYRAGYLLAYLAGRFPGLGVEVAAPWARSTNNARSQEIRDALRPLAHVLIGGLGGTATRTADLLQASGFVYPGSNIWVRSELPTVDFAGDYHAPDALLLAWNGVAHVLTTDHGLRQNEERLLAWWRFYEGAERTIHGIEDLRSGRILGSSRVGLWGTKLGSERVILWGMREQTCDLLIQKTGIPMKNKTGISRVFAFGKGLQWREILAEGTILGHQTTTGGGGIKPPEERGGGNKPPEDATSIHETARGEVGPSDSREEGGLIPPRAPGSLSGVSLGA